MKVLICPDIHGRNFWKNSCKNEYDHIVFLGDYLDAYEGETNLEEDIEVQITPESSIDNFKDIITLAKNNPEKVTLLLGNHDLPYFSSHYGRALSYWCRHDYKNHKEIENLFNNNIDLFKIAWECDNEKYGKVLFTHAGVTSKFKHICGLNASQINDFFLNGFTDKIPNIVGLASVSWYRGGFADSGSLVWADVREHVKSQVPEVFQIFGHTYSKDAIIMENFAMLDRGDSCYILTDEGLTKYDN